MADHATRPNGGPAANEPLAHNPAYNEPQRMERAEDSRAHKRAARKNGGLFLGLAVLAALLAGGFIWFNSTTEGGEEIARLAPEERPVSADSASGSVVVRTENDVAPTDGDAVVVRNPDGGAELVTPNGANGEPEVITVPNQTTPKFAVGSDAEYVTEEDGTVKTVAPGGAVMKE